MLERLIAVIAAGSIIAIAIIFTFRWEIFGDRGPTTLRLDHWTGQIVYCEFPVEKLHRRVRPGDTLDCGD